LAFDGILDKISMIQDVCSSRCYLEYLGLGELVGIPLKGGHTFEITHCSGGFNGFSPTVILKPSRRKLLLNHCYDCIISFLKNQNTSLHTSTLWHSREENLSSV